MILNHSENHCKLTVLEKDKNNLETHCQPNFGILATAGISFIIFFIILSYFSWEKNKFMVLIVSIPFLISIPVGFKYSMRDVKCTINLKSRQINFLKNGAFNSKFDKSDQVFALDSLVSVGMLRYRSRWADTFGIGLVWDSGDVTVLSGPDLSFENCHEYATQIQQFLGSEITVRAIG